MIVAVFLQFYGQYQHRLYRCSHCQSYCQSLISAAHRRFYKPQLSAVIQPLGTHHFKTPGTFSDLLGNDDDAAIQPLTEGLLFFGTQGYRFCGFIQIIQ